MMQVMSLVEGSRTGIGVRVQVDHRTKQRAIFKRPELHPTGSTCRYRSAECVRCAREGVGQDCPVLADPQVSRKAERNL